MSKMGAYVLELMEAGKYPFEPCPFELRNEGPFDSEDEKEVVCLPSEGSLIKSKECPL